MKRLEHFSFAQFSDEGDSIPRETDGNVQIDAATCGGALSRIQMVSTTLMMEQFLFLTPDRDTTGGSNDPKIMIIDSQRRLWLGVKAVLMPHGLLVTDGFGEVREMNFNDSPSISAEIHSTSVFSRPAFSIVSEEERWTFAPQASDNDPNLYSRLISKWVHEVNQVAINAAQTASIREKIKSLYLTIQDVQTTIKTEPHVSDTQLAIIAKTLHDIACTKAFQDEAEVGAMSSRLRWLLQHWSLPEMLNLVASMALRESAVRTTRHEGADNVAPASASKSSILTDATLLLTHIVSRSARDKLNVVRAAPRLVGTLSASVTRIRGGEELSRKAQLGVLRLLLSLAQVHEAVSSFIDNRTIDRLVRFASLSPLSTQLKLALQCLMSLVSLSGDLRREFAHSGGIAMLKTILSKPIADSSMDIVHQVLHLALVAFGSARVRRHSDVQDMTAVLVPWITISDSADDSPALVSMPNDGPVIPLSPGIATAVGELSLSGVQTSALLAAAYISSSIAQKPHQNAQSSGTAAVVSVGGPKKVGATMTSGAGVAAAAGAGQGLWSAPIVGRLTALLEAVLDEVSYCGSWYSRSSVLGAVRELASADPRGKDGMAKALARFVLAQRHKVVEHLMSVKPSVSPRGRNYDQGQGQGRYDGPEERAVETSTYSLDVPQGDPMDPRIRPGGNSGRDGNGVRGGSEASAGFGRNELIREVDVCLGILVDLCSEVATAEGLCSSGLVEVLEAMVSARPRWRSAATLLWSLHPSSPHLSLPTIAGTASAARLTSSLRGPTPSHSFSSTPSALAPRSCQLEEVHVFISCCGGPNGGRVARKLGDILSHLNLRHWIQAHDVSGAEDDEEGDGFDVNGDVDGDGDFGHGGCGVQLTKAALESAAMVICCVSHRYKTSAISRLVATQAINTKKKVVLLLLEKVKMSGWLSVFTGQVVHFDVGADLSNSRVLESLASLVKARFPNVGKYHEQEPGQGQGQGVHKPSQYNGKVSPWLIISLVGAGALFALIAVALWPRLAQHLGAIGRSAMPLSTPVMGDWDVEATGAWLARVGLGHIAAAFEEQRVSGPALATLRQLLTQQGNDITAISASLQADFRMTHGDVWALARALSTMKS